MQTSHRTYAFIVDDDTWLLLFIHSVLRNFMSKLVLIVRLCYNVVCTGIDPGASVRI